jgi:hypothetical protein
MASPVEAQLILCDAAQASSGKVHMLGAGWSFTTCPTAPHAVAVLMKVPWDRANERLALRLRLLDSDGQAVGVSSPNGPTLPVGTEAEVEVGRPPGIAPGSMLDASFAVSLPSLPLSPGRYEWRLSFAEQDFTAAFTVMPPR